MEIILTSKTDKGIKGLKKLEKEARKVLIKRLIRTKRISDYPLSLGVQPQVGTSFKNTLEAKKERLEKIELYLSSFCGLNKEDYGVEKNE